MTRYFKYIGGLAGLVLGTATFSNPDILPFITIPAVNYWCENFAFAQGLDECSRSVPLFTIALLLLIAGLIAGGILSFWIRSLSSHKPWKITAALFFFFALVAALYYAWFVNSPNYLDLFLNEDYASLILFLSSLPGFSYLEYFSTAWTGLYGGAVVIAFGYSLIGAILGGLIGKIVRRKTGTDTAH